MSQIKPRGISDHFSKCDWGFPGGSEVKASAWNAGDPGSIPGLGRSPGEGNGNPLQYPCLENPMKGGAWQATVHGVAKSRTQLSDFTSLNNSNFLSFLEHISYIYLTYHTYYFSSFNPAGSNGKESACSARYLDSIPEYRRFLLRREKEWLSTLVYLHGELHGQRNLAGFSPQGPKNQT